MSFCGLSRIDGSDCYAASKDEYVYDLYAVKEDNNTIVEDTSNPFPLYGFVCLLVDLLHCCTSSLVFIFCYFGNLSSSFLVVMDHCLWYRVQVDEDNEFYAGPIASDDESDDSNGIIHFIAIEYRCNSACFFFFGHLCFFFSVLS